MQGHENKPAQVAEKIRTVQVQGGVVNTRELLACDQKVLINHNSMLYELRITKQGKLLLTK